MPTLTTLRNKFSTSLKEVNDYYEMVTCLRLTIKCEPEDVARTFEYANRIRDMRKTYQELIKRHNRNKANLKRKLDKKSNV